MLTRKIYILKIDKEKYAYLMQWVYTIDSRIWLFWFLKKVEK